MLPLPLPPSPPQNTDGELPPRPNRHDGRRPGFAPAGWVAEAQGTW